MGSMSSRRQHRDWLLPIVFAVLVAACGSDKKESVATAPAGSATTPPAAPSAPPPVVPAPAVTATLGLAPGWTLRALKSVGNYKELFDRNLGTGSPLKLDRGLNDLYRRGGLMYSPPMQ